MEEAEGKVRVEKGEVAAEQMEEIKGGEYYTVGEVANRLRYSYTYILLLLQEGRIKGIKPIGGRWRIPKSEYNKVIKGGIPPLPREKEEEKKPQVTEIQVDEKMAKKIERKEEEKPPPKSLFPLDFSDLFGGGKKK